MITDFSFFARQLLSRWPLWPTAMLLAETFLRVRRGLRPRIRHGLRAIFPPLEGSLCALPSSVVLFWIVFHVAFLIQLAPPRAYGTGLLRAKIIREPSPFRPASLYAARFSLVQNVAWVIETVVPAGSASVSTLAPSCCASAFTIPVPSPVFD